MQKLIVIILFHSLIVISKIGIFYGLPILFMLKNIFAKVGN